MIKFSFHGIRQKLLLLTLLTATALSGQSKPQASGTLVLNNLTIVDGNGGAPQTHMTLVISDGRIADLFPDGKKSAPAGATVMDLSGRYAIPGLIDSHYHFMLGLDEKSAEENRRRFALLGGVTSVRDMAGDAIALAELAKSASDPATTSPRVYFSALMAGENFLMGDARVKAIAHGLKAGEIAWARAITSQTNIAQVVAEAKKTGATGIKIYAELPPDIIAKITAEAHRQGLKVWSHATVFPARPGDAVAAGVDTISHSMDLVFEGMDKVPDKFKGAYKGLNWYDVPVESEAITALLQRMRKQGTILDATLVVSQRVANKQLALDKSARVIPDPQRMLDWTFAVTKRAHQLGVTISAGTDITEGLTSKEFPNIHTEMELLVTKCGLTPLEAIAAATRNGAKAIGVENSYGTIARGKAADIIILTADPTQEITNTTKILYVIKGGRLHQRETATDKKSEAESKDADSKDADSKDAAELRNLVRAWDEADVKGDAATLERILADEFSFVGGANKAQYISFIKIKSPETYIESAVSEDVQVQVYGDAAVVTGLDTVKGKENGQAYVKKWLYLDVWIRRAGRWQCVKTYSSLSNK